jgi:hypothetical protein
MQYKWLVGLLLIGGVLVPVHEQIVGIQNDQDSYEVTEPQNHVQIPRPVNVARPPDSTAEPQELQQASLGAAHSDLKAKFDVHIRRAESGDAASMLIIAETIETCAPVGSYQDWDQYANQDDVAWSGQLDQFSPDELDVSKAWFNGLVAECSGINEHVPADGGFAKWMLDWYERAAAAGNLVARLRLLSFDSPSEEHRRSMALVLNDAMATSDDRVTSDFRLYEAAYMFSYRYPAEGSGSSDVVGETWGYLACLHRKECNVSEMRDSFDAQYSPAEVAAILEAAELFEHGSAKNVDFLSSSAFQPDEGN